MRCAWWLGCGKASGANAIFLGLLGRLGWVCAKICGADQALSARPFTFGLFCFCLGLGRWSVGDVSHPGCSSFVGKYCCALSLVVRKGSSVLIFFFFEGDGRQHRAEAWWGRYI